MKKFIAKLTLVALALAFVPTANAAGVVITASANLARTEITVALPAGVDLEGGNADADLDDDFTVQVTNTATGAAIDLSGAALPTALTLGVNDEFAQADLSEAANGYIIVTDLAADAADGDDIVITLPALATDTAYTVSYRDTDGNYGIAMFNTGVSNQVVVTATVEPVLTMSLTEEGVPANPKTAIALGILPTAANTYSDDTLDVLTGTNALQGVVVTMTSAGLKDLVNDREIGVTDISADGAGAENTAATDYYKVQSENAAVPAVLADANGADIYSAAGTDMLATQTVVDINNAHNVTATTITIAARAALNTESGDYSDTLTFTATAQF